MVFEPEEANGELSFGFPRPPVLAEVALVAEVENAYVVVGLEAWVLMRRPDNEVCAESATAGGSKTVKLHWKRAWPEGNDAAESEE